MLAGVLGLQMMVDAMPLLVTGDGGLAALETGRRAMDLKYSNVGDYAREELGLNASTAAKSGPKRARPPRSSGTCTPSPPATAIG